MRVVCLGNDIVHRPSGECDEKSRRWLDLLERNIAPFAFLLHCVWEMLQSGFFERVKDTPHVRAVVDCTRATFGDVAIQSPCLLGRRVGFGARSWPLRSTRRQIDLFVRCGLAATIVLAILATRV